MKKLLTVIITALMLLTIVGCQKHENKPYEPDTPAPDPHTGVFSCEYGSMEFNGDGKTATVGVGMVTEKRIPVLLRIDGKNVTAMFEK